MALSQHVPPSQDSRLETLRPTQSSRSRHPFPSSPHSVLLGLPTSYVCDARPLFMKQCKAVAWLEGPLQHRNMYRVILFCCTVRLLFGPWDSDSDLAINFTRNRAKRCVRKIEGLQTVSPQQKVSVDKTNKERRSISCSRKPLGVNVEERLRQWGDVSEEN